MKNILRNVLQKLFGFDNYLFVFSLYCIRKFKNGQYEKELKHFIALAENEGIILDIGANIGITAAPLAKYLDRAEVHAYEPISENFTTLKRIAKFLHLKNLKLYNFALGNDTGELKMIMPMFENARMQGLSKAYVEGENTPGVMYTVPLKRLDDLYPNEGRIKAIKIDVENFEFEVLKGSKELLKRNMPLIYCELWDNENRQLVFELLSSIGYSNYYFDEKLNTIRPFSAAIPESLSNNFFFIKSN